jgi:glycosyltransferase involved in cell wall biosynthesis
MTSPSAPEPDVATRDPRATAPTTHSFSIICLSPQDWRVDLPTNRQQIMLRAARRGHEVLFVETGHFVGRHLVALARGPNRRSLWRRLRSTEEVVPGLRLRKGINLLPGRTSHRLSNLVNCALSARLIRRVARAAPRPVVLWIYDAISAGMAGSCGEDLAVYDCVDDYVEQTRSLRGRALMTACDRTAAMRSQLVFSTTHPVYERQRSLNRKTHLVSNAGDYEHFARAADTSTTALEVVGLPRPVFGFAGNFLATKVDFELLEHVASARSECTLLLIGPSTPETLTSLERLGRLPNVRWLGRKPYDQLPTYVAAFDVGLIPYVANDYTRSCFPLKLYEYLAAGKPVVASGLPELAEMEPDVVLADSPASFVDAIGAALGRAGATDRARRMQIASRNSWEARTDKLLGLVQAELDGRDPVL